MNFLNIAQSRYTTKKYNPLAKISKEKISELKEILRLSPSSINSQPWKFTFVSNEELKNKLAEVSYFNEQKIKEASHLVVFSVIDNIEKFEDQINQTLPQGAVGYYNSFLKPQSEAEIKAWLAHQVYISLGYFLSACATLGIDSSPMEGIKPEEYARILELKDYKTLFVVALGYRAGDDANQPTLKPKSRLTLESITQSL